MNVQSSTDRRWLWPLVVWGGIGGLVLYVALVAANFNSDHTSTTVLAFVLVVGVVVAAHAVATDADRRWLPPLIIFAFGLKLLASGVRYWILVSVYNRVGDASGYHGRGLTFADSWRAFEVPQFDVGGAGTIFTSKTVGLVYAPYEPTMLGGFFLFATIAFAGQILFYAAFRRALPGLRLHWYAVAVLLLPSLLFWPASIGKEALMVLFLGTAAYGAARLFGDYALRWVVVVGAGLAAAAAIRLHVAAILGGSVGVALILSRPPQVPLRQVRRWSMVGVGAGVVAFLAVSAGSQLGFSIGGDSIDPLLDELQRRTQQGGSAVDGEVATSLSSLPGALLRVLFRPLPYEAHNAQAMISAMEGAILLVFTVWRLPWIVRNIRHLRNHPYVIVSFGFTIAFVVVFSSIFNFGILARQRSQVLPFLLALIVAAGWRLDAAEPDAASDDLTQQHQPIGATK